MRSPLTYPALPLPSQSISPNPHPAALLGAQKNYGEVAPSIGTGVARKPGDVMD